MAAAASLSKRPARSAQLFRVAGLEQAVEGEHAEAEVVDRGVADDGVAGDARLPAAHGHLAGSLALQRLLVEPALAGHHERGGAHAGVEAERVEHERRAADEPRAAVGVEAAGEAATGPGQGDAARIARRLCGEGGEAPLE